MRRWRRKTRASQNYDPLGNIALAMVATAVPAFALFFLLAVKRSPAWRAALYGCAAAVVMAWLVLRMPPQMIAGAVSSGLVLEDERDVHAMGGYVPRAWEIGRTVRVLVEVAAQRFVQRVFAEFASGASGEEKVPNYD